MMRLIVIVFVVAGVLAIGAVAWMALDLPPLKLVLPHGLPPAGGPTGRVKEIEGIRFVEIGTGYFRMGSWFYCTKGDLLGRICKVFHLPWGKQPQEKWGEVPVRWVEIRQPYWIAETEVTNLQFERFDPKHERSEWSPDDNSPVSAVSWEEARAYCDWLSRRCSLALRLPSEAEWENACRGGSMTEYCFGNDEASLGEYAWFAENSGGPAHAVGTKHPNAWGLYDMHGNAWEWCADSWHRSYRGAPNDASKWTGGSVEAKTCRGGPARGSPAFCRSAVRMGVPLTERGVMLGFRPAASSH